MNLESIFGIKADDNMLQEKENAEYDKHADFYYTNLINSIVLFSMTKGKLEALAAPAFDPLFELESEIDYAYTPVCFETIFRNGLIETSLKNDLIDFKKETDNIPNEIWDWEYIANHQIWIQVRERANSILDKLGVEQRSYNEDYMTLYDSDGNVIKKGKKL